MQDPHHLLAVARGEAPADLLLRRGRLINVFTGTVEETSIAIAGERIAGLGEDYHSINEIDLDGAYVSPGWIDAHVHIESSLCTPAEFAAMVTLRGITSCVIDPHEVPGRAGAAGVRYMADQSRGLGLNVITMAPSCVPATALASSGATLACDDLLQLRDSQVTHGLAELMNYPAVVNGDPLMRAKMLAMTGRPLDGHCPGLTGKALNAYIAAGVGSDHEAITPAEAVEKLSRGLYLLIREATNARNLDALLTIITPGNSRRVCFCSDDRTAGDLIRSGSIDDMIRRAISFGIDPVEAIRMATLNTAEWFGLGNIGAIAPGRRADLVVFDDLQQPRARMVWCNGRRVDETAPAATAPADPLVMSRCNINWDAVSFAIPATGSRIRVIGSLPDQLLTEHRIMACKVVNNQAVADVGRDILKMAVIERHHATGKMGLGFIQAFGLQRGAIAGTVAHDHHNLVVIGADDVSMQTAARAAGANGGGLAIAEGETVTAHLPLPVAGLMSNLPAAQVAARYQKLVDGARALGSTLVDPFMAMSFMALEVIPSLKLTDHGLIDVERFEKVSLFV